MRCARPAIILLSALHLEAQGYIPKKVESLNADFVNASTGGGSPSSSGHDDEALAEVCGLRAIAPGFHFELQLLRQLSLLRGNAPVCSLPAVHDDFNVFSPSILAMLQEEGEVGASSVDGEKKHLSPEIADAAGTWLHLWASLWLVCAFASLWRVGAWRRPISRKPSAAVAVAESGKLAALRSTLEWLSMASLDPIVRRCTTSDKVDSTLLQETVPDFSMSVSPLAQLPPPASLASTAARAEAAAAEAAKQAQAPPVLRDIWRRELAASGTKEAKLLRAVFRFLGVRACVELLLCSLVASAAEFFVITALPDLLFHDLLWVISTAGAVGLHSRCAHGLLTVVFGFAMPMAARVCWSAVGCCSGRYTGKVIAGLLLLVTDSRQPHHQHQAEGPFIDEAHLVSSDIVGAWSTIGTDIARIAAAPVTFLALLVLLVWMLGSMAGLSFLTASCLCASAWFWGKDGLRGRWSRLAGLADERSRLTRDMAFGAAIAKATGATEHLSARLLQAREAELEGRADFGRAQVHLAAPLALVPGWACLCSLLQICFTGAQPEKREIFVCMQLAVGLFYYTSFLGTSAGGLVTWYFSVERVEQFLKERASFTPHSRSNFPVAAAAAAEPAACNSPTASLSQGSRRAVLLRSPASPPPHDEVPLVRVRGCFPCTPVRGSVLHNLDFFAKRGELVAVVGAAGSGKSALLAAIRRQLGGDAAAFNHAPSVHDAPPPEGSSALSGAWQRPALLPSGKVSCIQVAPWVLHGSIRDNVTVGRSFDQAKFQAAVDAVALECPTQVAANWLATQPGEEISEGGLEPGLFPYFSIWYVLATVCLVLAALNVRWGATHPMAGVLMMVIESLLHWSVLEIPIQAVAVMLVRPARLKRADGRHLSVVLNYNLLAVSRADVDECMENMFEAFIGNVGDGVSAVLVSATSDPELQEYELHVRDVFRERIYAELMREGLVWAGLGEGVVDPGREKRLWRKYSGWGKSAVVQSHLHSICQQLASEFKVLHRVSRVLRKCGQYQDLMLLSAGDTRAFSYCDRDLYGDGARRFGEPLFFDSPDTRSIIGRNFDYTLVLDSDTQVEGGNVAELLRIAAAYPDRAIIQPAIRMSCGTYDSVFMYLEALRQSLHEPMTRVLTSMLGESGFYGKGLIKNSAYIEKCIGIRERLIEAVPIDVLSHDTFEAALLRPLYVSDVHLLEAPCHNLVTWDIRERRWNRGEILLAMYFFPRLIGVPMRWAQRKMQGASFLESRVRTSPRLSGVSVYIAHSALRQIAMKPLLVCFIILKDFVPMYYDRAPICIVMFCILIFPKLAIVTRCNWKAVLLETVASVLQFTPESVVGSIRLVRALKAHVTGNARWVPQRAVEEEVKASNPFVFSLRYLWYYAAFAVFAGTLVIKLVPQAEYIMLMLGTMFALPFYAGLTALSVRMSSIPPMCRVYFSVWHVLALVCMVLDYRNVDWTRTPTGVGIATVAVQATLHWTALELPLQATLALFVGKPKLLRADCDHISVVLNYNLTATTKADVEECMRNMYEAFINSLDHIVSAVLVSATHEPTLQEYEVQLRDEYREQIYAAVMKEGLIWAGVENGVLSERQTRFWSKFADLDRNAFLQTRLVSLCKQCACEFMVLHRQSTVLGKCGHYQDLMLLSAGTQRAFTYCDKRLYGSAARPLGELMFRPCEDANRICGRSYDYTLVLDNSTRVEPGCVRELLQIAAAHPDRALLQPAIRMAAGIDDSAFTHLEALRHSLLEPLTGAVSAILGQSTFHGKGLIQNSVYIERCLGSLDSLVEAVPIDVLSHDTFEASFLKPLYVGEVELLEVPCNNYISWDFAERRRNMGELQLACYLFPIFVGIPMRWAQRQLRRLHFKTPRTRRQPSIDKVSAFIAHGALRQLAAKPLLVVCVVLGGFVQMHSPLLPIFSVLFFSIVLPRLLVFSRSNCWAVFLDTLASVLQFTPEFVVGTIRLVRALKAHLTGNARWVPQCVVEQEVRRSQPFVLSWRYLWHYMAFAVSGSLIAYRDSPEATLVYVMLGAVFTLPVYAAVTGCRGSCVRCFFRVPSCSSNSNSTAQAMRQESTQAHYIDVAGLTSEQRWRIALARAAYDDDASVALLDDAFCKLDAPVSERLIRDVLRGRPFAERVCVVAFSHPDASQLRLCDRVVVMSQGCIVAQGPPEQVIDSDAFQALGAPCVGTFSKDGSGVMALSSTAELTAARPLPHSILPLQRPAKGDACSVTAVPVASLPRAWATAMKAGGYGKLLMIVLTVFLFRLTMQCQLLVLGRWLDDKQEMNPGHLRDEYFIAAIASLALLAAALQLLQGHLLVAFETSASRTVFSGAVKRAVQALETAVCQQSTAGDRNSIASALPGDVVRMDAASSANLVGLLGFLLSLSVQQVYLAFAFPLWLFLCTNSLMAGFCMLFIGTTGALQHSRASALTAFQTHQRLSNEGQLSVAAAGLGREMCRRQLAAISTFVSTDFLGTGCAKQWLVLRLTACLCFQSTTCALFGALQPEYVVSSGNVAVVIVSTFSILQELNSFVDALSDAVSLGGALHRMGVCTASSYAAPQISDEVVDAAAKRDESIFRLFSNGAAVAAENLSVCSGHSDLPMPPISFRAAGGTRLAIVGPSGSGKTAMLLAMLRMLQPLQGRILLGGVDVRRLSDVALRRALGYVPQEPVAFQGSVRFNMDPSGLLPDERLWDALAAVNLADFVVRAGGLNMPLASSAEAGGPGTHLSAGQLRLFNVARVISQRPAIVLLDGCATALDGHSWQSVQDALASRCAGATVVATSASLGAVADFEQVINLGRGGMPEQPPVPFMA